MSSTIDTPITETRTAETHTPALEAPHRPDAPRPSRARGDAAVWVAAIAACIAVVTIALVIVLSGGNDDSDVPPPRFDWHAEHLERQAQLEGQADTYSADRDAVTTGDAASDYARFRAAERNERAAQLEAQADTHSQGSIAEPEQTDQDDTPEPAFLPGSRHVPTR